MGYNSVADIMGLS